MELFFTFYQNLMKIADFQQDQLLDEAKDKKTG